MLKDAGASFVIVGHSERRADHGETDVDVKAQGAPRRLPRASSAIVCVGESEAERDAGKAERCRRRRSSKARCPTAMWPTRSPSPTSPSGRSAPGARPRSTISARCIARSARNSSSFYGDGGADIRILYGGSVKAENAAEILRAGEVGGALVGGASLTAESFLGIIVAAAELLRRLSFPCDPRPGSLSARLDFNRKRPQCRSSCSSRSSRPSSPPRWSTVVLMQRSEGGGLGMGGGGSPAGLMSARGAADFLTRATAILATLFVGLSILLAAIGIGATEGRVDRFLARPQTVTAEKAQRAAAELARPDRSRPAGAGSGFRTGEHGTGRSAQQGAAQLIPTAFRRSTVD